MAKEGYVKVYLNGEFNILFEDAPLDIRKFVRKEMQKKAMELLTTHMIAQENIDTVQDENAEE